MAQGVEQLLIDEEDQDNVMLKYFKPLSLIGKGSFGQVISAYDFLTKQNVAIKIIDKKPLSKHSLEIIKKEAQILSKLNHRNIVRYRMSKETTAKLFIIMEYVEGQSLEKLIRTHKQQNKKFNQNEIRSIIKQLLTAVEYIHQQDIIHRDIKPENILIRKDEFDEDYLLKLIDFGLSYQQEQEIFQPNDNCGTLLYMAPEVALKNTYDSKIDIWSIGIVLYQMYTLGGHPLWMKNIDNRKSFLKKLINPDIKLLPNMERDILTFFCKTTSFKPEFRLSATQALQHPWILGVDSEEPLNEMIAQFSQEQNFFKIIVWILVLKKLVEISDDKYVFNITNIDDLKKFDDRDDQDKKDESKESYNSQQIRLNSAQQSTESNRKFQKKSHFSQQFIKKSQESENNEANDQAQIITNNHMLHRKLIRKPQPQQTTNNFFEDRKKLGYAKSQGQLHIDQKILNDSSKKSIESEKQEGEKKPLKINTKTLRKVMSHEEKINFLKQQIADSQAGIKTTSPNSATKFPPLNPSGRLMNNSMIHVQKKPNFISPQEAKASSNIKPPTPPLFNKSTLLKPK